MYSVEQVADQLGLHVRTVRGYIRAGRLKAVRIGKQYRVARGDLDELTGKRHVSLGWPVIEVSSIVQIEGVDHAAADRLSTLVLATANTARGLRIQAVYDEERVRMKFIVLGGAGATAEVLRMLEAVLDNDNGLLSKGEADGG